MDTVKTLQIEQIDAQTVLARFTAIELAVNTILARFAPQSPNDLLTRQEVADLFKVTKVTVWDWTKKGLLKSYRIGRHVRYKRAEVLAATVFIENKVRS